MWMCHVSRRASDRRIAAMAQPRMSKQAEQIQQLKNMSGTPIKIMTFGLLGLTVWFAYDLYNKKRFPHQNG